MNSFGSILHGLSENLNSSELWPTCLPGLMDIDQLCSQVLVFQCMACRDKNRPGMSLYVCLVLVIGEILMPGLGAGDIDAVK